MTPIALPLAQHELFHSTDLDETRAHVARVFCDHRLTLGDGERRIDARQHVARLGETTLSYLDYGGAVEIDSRPLHSFYLVSMPLRGAAAIRCGGDEILSTPALASVPHPDDELSMGWHRDTPHLIVRFERPSLEARLRDLLDRPLTEPLRFELGFDLSGAAGVRWRIALELALAEIAAADIATNAGLGVGPLEDLLGTLLLCALPSNYSTALRTRAAPPGPRHVRTAVAFIDAHTGEPLTAAAIARAADVSVRSLQEGFRRTVGKAPMAYLRDARLDRVHADLQAGGATVTEAACRWGFTHLGRFAGAYRSRFGESPSATRRRANLPNL